MKTSPTHHPDGVAAAVTAPFRFKHILVPVDFSACSKKALEYALPLAQQHDAALTLLHVVPMPPFAAGEQGVVDYSAKTFLQTSGEQELATLVQNEVRGKCPADAVVRVGAPAIEIVELAKSLPADIIVISTHGHSGLKHVFLGSVTEQVVRHAPCPVLVVRECENEFLAVG